MRNEIILICGSRYDFDIPKVIELITSVIRKHPGALFIHGGAKGVDTITDNILKLYNIDTEIHHPDYAHYGHTAPLIRDKAMVDNADKVYAFWNGISRGTKYTIDYAKKQGKSVIVKDIRRK